MKTCRFESRTYNLCFIQIKCREDGGEIHVQVLLEFKLQLVFTPARQGVNSNVSNSFGDEVGFGLGAGSAPQIREDDDARAGLEQCLDFGLDLLADVRLAVADDD